MGIPAPPSLDPLAFHSPVTWHGIINDTREQSTMMRHARDERRSIIKHIHIASRPLLDRLFKCAVLFPELHQVFLIFYSLAARAFFELHCFSLKIKSPWVTQELAERTVPSCFFGTYLR